MNKTKVFFLSAGVLGIASMSALLIPANASAMSQDADTTCYGSSHVQADETVVQALQDDGRFSTLLAAVNAAGLEGALNSSDQKTVFAPTDEAFAALPAGTVESLLNDVPTLTKILTYHVVDGAVDSDTALDLGGAKTLNGQSVDIGEGDDGAYVNDAKLLETDIDTDNGVVHVIDSVLMPEL